MIKLSSVYIYYLILFNKETIGFSFSFLVFNPILYIFFLISIFTDKLKYLFYIHIHDMKL